jgi:hypothetical protein
MADHDHDKCGDIPSTFSILSSQSIPAMTASTLFPPVLIEIITPKIFYLYEACLTQEVYTQIALALYPFGKDDAYEFSIDQKGCFCSMPQPLLSLYQMHIRRLQEETRDGPICERSKNRIYDTFIRSVLSEPVFDRCSFNLLERGSDPYGMVKCSRKYRPSIRIRVGFSSAGCE